MPLFILTLKSKEQNKNDYDYYDSKVIRAKNEENSRKLANKNTSNEGKIWEDKSKVNCKELKIDGKEKVILESFNAG